MITQLTTTTGTVKGGQQCAAFILLACLTCKEVFAIQLWIPGGIISGEYIQYTLLTDNRINIFI